MITVSTEAELYYAIKSGERNIFIAKGIYDMGNMAKHIKQRKRLVYLTYRKKKSQSKR